MQSLVKIEQKISEIRELSAKIEREKIKGHIEIAKMMKELDENFDSMAYFDEVGIKVGSLHDDAVEPMDFYSSLASILGNRKK